MLANGVRGLAESLSLSPFNTASRSLEVAKRHPQKSLPREDWDQHCCTAGPVDSFAFLSCFCERVSALIGPVVGPDSRHGEAASTRGVRPHCSGLSGSENQFLVASVKGLA